MMFEFVMSGCAVAAVVLMGKVTSQLSELITLSRAARAENAKGLGVGLATSADFHEPTHLERLVAENHIRREEEAARRARPDFDWDNRPS